LTSIFSGRLAVVTDSFISQSDIEQTRIQSFGFVFAIVFAVLISAIFVVYGSAGPGQSAGIRLEARINPNDAPWASLVRLPGIGAVKAAAIVAYRENFGSAVNPTFLSCDDLQKVHGIGPKTAQNICQWLRFE
jgi:competence ComEA-like helix-hairpin-helix protein